MQISISYSHSGFPELSDPELSDGISSLQSRMRTTVSASLKWHNISSPWSPLSAPAPNSLFELLEQHWGVAKATEAMQQILVQRSTPRRPANTQSRRSLEPDYEFGKINNPMGMVAPRIPVRQTSLQQVCPLPQPPSTATNRGQDPRKLSYQRYSVGIADTWTFESSSRKKSPQSSLHPKGEESSARKRRTLDAAAFRSMLPMMSSLSSETSEFENKIMRAPATGQVRGRKEPKLWNWVNWF